MFDSVVILEGIPWLSGDGLLDGVRDVSVLEGFCEILTYVG